MYQLELVPGAIPHGNAEQFCILAMKWVRNQCCETLGLSLDTAWPSPQSEVTFIFSTTAGACQQIIESKRHMKSFRRQS